MGGVDLTDQMVSYYSLSQRKAMKWWKKVFWRMFHLAILNLSVVFRHNFPASSIKSNRQFRLCLFEEMVKPLFDARVNPTSPIILQSAPGRKPSASPKRLIGKHFPFKKQV